MKHSIQIKEYKKSLFGRIKLNLAKLITGKDNKIPTKNQSVKYFANNSEGQPSLWAFLIHSIIVDNATFPLAYSEVVKEQKELKLVFDSLVSHFTGGVANLTIYNCPKPLPEEIVVWVMKDQYKGQESDEFVLVAGGEEAPDKVLSIFIISLEGNDEIIVQSLDTEKNKFVDFSKNFQELLFKLCISCFCACDSYAPFNLIMIDRLKGENLKRNLNNEKFHPPEDTKLMQLIYEVKNGERECIIAEVDTKDIELFDLDFAYSIPDQLILDGFRHLYDLKKYGVLTYESNGKLIVSDDYITFLALRVENNEVIRVVNLGEFEKVMSKKVIKRGGIELFPPIYAPGSEKNVSKDYKIERLEEKIKIVQKLRIIKNSLSDNFESIKTAIKENKLENAILHLERICIDPIMRNNVVAVNARLDKLKNDINYGVIDKQNELLEYNRIRQALLQLIEDL